MGAAGAGGEMTASLLENDSFERGWTDIDGETQQPNGWTYYYFDHTTPNPHDSADHAVFRKPELVHKSKNELPPAEHDLFILDGDWTLKAFKDSGSIWFGLRQTLFLEPGTYHFSVFIYGDLVKAYDGDEKVWADDPQGRDGLLRFTLNDSDYDNWESVEPGQWNYFELDFAAEGETTVGVEIMCPFPLRNAGVFMDDWQLVKIEEGPPGGRGQPRVQYKRVYNVLPQDATHAQAHEVLDAIFDEKQTLGWSSDDAYVGDLDDRTAVEWFRKEADVPEFAAFYEEYGTGVKVAFENIIKPNEPEPEPLGEVITLHRQTNIDGLYEYIAKVKPAWVKLVGGFEDAQRVKAASPETKVLIRHVTDHQGQYLDSCDVNAFLAQFSDSLEANAQWIDAFEGLNEEAPNDKLVRFAVALSNETRRRYGNSIAACLLNLAVGNGEPGVLLPVAQACDDNGHFVGYHAYNPVNLANAETWLEEVAEWYHLRALYYMDPYFRQHGAFPRYLFTEAGAVRADAKPDGGVGGLDPAGGWRSATGLNADLGRYIALLLRLREMIGVWNAQHSNRAEALMLFTVGAAFVGWDNFKLWTDDLDALANALVGN